jgi:alkanesulfonate monooxygenase SsuD/methylene tetrahydromethanopterin reductase-like flavin-dependent oxidoreductase (luciferase family)
MKVGILQFFGWRDRSVPLTSVYATALERVTVMDQTGYDAIWLAEHHFSSFSVCPSVHMMGTMAAARSKRLRIGMAVSLAPFYNPLRLAEEVALLDILSGGRVNWGAGRGFSIVEYSAFGVPGSESTERFHEVVDIVLQAWKNERLTYKGKFYEFENVEVLPKPLQQPLPPVWMAASSRGAIEWAASEGHSILMDPHCSRAELGDKRRHYADVMRQHGHSDEGRDIPMARLIALADTAEQAREIAARGAKWMVGSYIGDKTHVRNEQRTFDGMDPVEFYLQKVILHGTPASVVEQIRDLEETAQANYLMFAPLSQKSFSLLTDKVVPHVVK